jgi:putative membrane protein
MPLIPHWPRRAGAGWALVLISVPALAHNPLASQGPEQWAALITVAWLLSFWGLYLWGSTRVSPGWLSAMVFHLTAILCAVTLLGPLDDWAKTSTAAHMVQHMLLMVVIAPLWVLCRPLPQLNAGGGPPAARIWRPGLQLARYPMYAAFLHGAIVWFWHMPYFYMLAVENVWWHAFEHACFIVTAGIFWWAILRAGQARTLWALVALLFTLMHTGFLGALLTFARDPLYAETRDLQDQQLAGLIMWVAGAVPYLIASAWMGHRWFQRICPA